VELSQLQQYMAAASSPDVVFAAAVAVDGSAAMLSRAQQGQAAAGGVEPSKQD
jgi:hypothetical protein